MRTVYRMFAMLFLSLIIAACNGSNNPTERKGGIRGEIVVDSHRKLIVFTFLPDKMCRVIGSASS